MPQISITETAWNEAYTQLYAYVRNQLVYSLHVLNWRGQEEEVAWDIVQESMSRFVEHVQKADRGEREPVRSIMGFLKVTAQHYGRDLRRREWRLSREDASMLRKRVDDETSFREAAVENVYRAYLFHILAHEIAGFPKKQRRSLLADLAHRMAFEEKPTTLEVAFRAEGIFLEEYRTNRTEGEQERKRNASLLSHAYKRLHSLEAVQKYLAS